jgi:hypothetical protein
MRGAVRREVQMVLINLEEGWRGAFRPPVRLPDAPAGPVPLLPRVQRTLLGHDRGLGGGEGGSAAGAWCGVAWRGAVRARTDISAPMRAGR